MKKVLSVLMMALIPFVAAPVMAAADYPSKPISLVVPFPPGGPTDGMARQLASGLSDELGVPVIVENKAGAGGNIGSGQVAMARPDGHTLLFGTSGPLAINISIYDDITYDPRTSFEPIIRIGHLPNILVVNPDVPATNLQELIAYSKENPEALTYGSSGNGASSHLAGILFNNIAGTDILHIPYRGTGPALIDLLGGQISMSFTDVMTALPHTQQKTLRPIGLTTAERSPVLPDLPTLAESGLEGYDVSVFFGIVAPKGTDDAIILKLNQAFTDVMAREDIKEVLAQQGIVQADDKTPEGLKTFIDDEVTKWADVIESANVAMD